LQIKVEMDEQWSFYNDTFHQIWLWWAVDHESGEAIAFWFGTREHHHLDKLKELLSPLNIGTVYTDGHYAYFERFSSEVLVVSKRNTQKIERKHLALRTWRLVRRGIRFSKTEQMHKIAVGPVINVPFIHAFFAVMPFRTENTGTCLKIKHYLKSAEKQKGR
jgi:insertion element IS1 protein InsB